MVRRLVLISSIYYARKLISAWGELKALVPDAETAIREASPRPAIVNAALELKCQMIVMGTHGHSGLEHLLLGSVADYVVRNSRVPVLTVREN